MSPLKCCPGIVGQNKWPCIFLPSAWSKAVCSLSGTFCHFCWLPVPLSSCQRASCWLSFGPGPQYSTSLEGTIHILWPSWGPSSLELRFQPWSCLGSFSSRVKCGQSGGYKEGADKRWSLKVRCGSNSEGLCRFCVGLILKVAVSKKEVIALIGFWFFYFYS